MVKLNSQRNNLPTNPFKIGRFIKNHQQSCAGIIAEITALNDLLENNMQPKLYGDGFYYCKIDTNYSSHDWPSHSSVQSEWVYDKKDAPTDHDNFYVEPEIKFGKLSTRRNKLCWTVDRYYSRAWGNLPLTQQKQSLADDLTIVFAEFAARLAKKLGKNAAQYNTQLAIEHASAIINAWLKTTADVKYYDRINKELVDAKADHERLFN